MEGIRSVSDDQQQQQQNGIGIIPRSFQQIFTHVHQHPEQQLLIRCSYLEIYNEEIHDLLSPTPLIKLDVKEGENGVYVKYLKEFVVFEPSQMEELMRKGQENRAIGATAMNANSSRSHSIFTITIEACDKAQ